jgi:signal transduction histidine kinase
MQNAKTHNSVLIIMTVACLGAVVESITQGWEYWVPPLIIGGLIAAWGFHLAQYNSMVFRENYYLSFSLMVAFYHGAHESSFFDVVVVSMLLMVTVTLLKRIGFLRLTLAEVFIVMLMQIGLAIEKKTIDFDLLTVSRILLHAVVAFCVYKALGVIIKSNCADTEELELRNKEKETEKTEMEDFLVNISHELRTPVNVINGLSSLILKKEYSDDVASIRDAGIMLSRHIEDIQDFSEIARGDVHLEIDKYMITSVVNDLMVDQYLAERRNNLDLIIDIDPNIPAVLRGDSGKISKIIRHLLSNSFKFTRRGGVLLRITSVKHDYGVNLIIEVTDTGAGMSASEIDKVSRGLYQANTKRNRSTGGIGLGLNIV